MAGISLGGLSGRNLKQRLAAPLDEAWDRRLGLHTFGYNPEQGAFGDPEWASCFVPLPWRDIFDALDAAGLGAGDVFTDLGSGTGRAVFAASYRGARRAVGVERVAWLAAAAERNRREGRLRDRDIRFVEADARAISLAETTVLYFYHSFGTGVLAEVLARAKADRAAAGAGRLRVCYVNPVYEQMLDDCDWLKPCKTLAPHKRFLRRPADQVTRIWESL